MILTCPQCQTKYRLDESKLSPEGSKVRCSRCQNVFLAYPSAPEADAVLPEETPAPSVAPAEPGAPAAPSTEDMEQLFSAPAGAPKAADPTIPPLPSDFDDDDLFGPDESPSGIPVPGAPAPQPAPAAPLTAGFGPASAAGQPFEDDDDLFAGLDSSPTAKPSADQGLDFGTPPDDLPDDFESLLTGKPAAEAAGREGAEQEEQRRQLQFEDDEDLFGALGAMGPVEDTGDKAPGHPAGESGSFDQFLAEEGDLLSQAPAGTGAADHGLDHDDDPLADLAPPTVEHADQDHLDEALAAASADMDAEGAEDAERAAARAKLDQGFDEPAEGGVAAEEPRQSSALGLEDNVTMLPGAEPRRVGYGRMLLLLLLMVLVLLCGGGAAVYFLELEPMLPAWVPENIRQVLRQPVTKVVTPAGEGKEEQVRLISLENVRQYTLPNQKAGQIFVVEGKAVNNFPTAKESIKVDVALYDARGKTLTTRSVLCGNTLSLFQLQIMSKAEIEAALNAEAGIKSANSNLQTGQSVSFMAVFFDPPASVSEFGATVVQAVDTAGQ